MRTSLSSVSSETPEKEVSALISSLLVVGFARTDPVDIVHVIEFVFQDKRQVQFAPYIFGLVKRIEKVHGPYGSTKAVDITVSTSPCDLWVWGRGEAGRLGINGVQAQKFVFWVILFVDGVRDPVMVSFFNQTKIRSVKTFANHSLAIDCQGIAYSWGKGDNGRLGHGDTSHRLV